MYQLFCTDLIYHAPFIQRFIKNPLSYLIYHSTEILDKEQKKK
jgi:hypothetical protein